MPQRLRIPRVVRLWQTLSTKTGLVLATFPQERGLTSPARSESLSIGIRRERFEPIVPHPHSDWASAVASRCRPIFFGIWAASRSKKGRNCCHTRHRYIRRLTSNDMARGRVHLCVVLRAGRDYSRWNKTAGIGVTQESVEHTLVRSQLVT
jgi:hypothetical protein